MELLDVVNINDEIIGQATRDECHKNPDLIHHTVHFTLFDKANKKVFITQRSFKKTHDGGKYCFLGEHILSGETYIQALTRGCKEELGFTPKEYKEVCKHFFKYDTQSEICKFYIIFWNGEKLSWDTNELDQGLWLESNDIKSTHLDLSDMAKYWIENINWEVL